MTFDLRYALKNPDNRAAFYKDISGNAMPILNSTTGYMPTTHAVSTVLTSGSGVQTMLECRNGVIDFLAINGTSLPNPWVPHIWVTVDNRSAEHWTNSQANTDDYIFFLNPTILDEDTSIYVTDPIYFNYLKIQCQITTSGNFYLKYRARYETYIGSF